MSYARPRKYLATEATDVDTSTLVLKSGDTMTGVLTLASGGITTDSQTYTANQLKTALNAANAALPLAGGSMTGALSITAGSINQLTLTNTTGASSNMLFKNTYNHQGWSGFNNDNLLTYGTITNNSLGFVVNNLHRMFIHTNGNTGIGTGATAPSSTLHVNGSFQAGATSLNGLLTLNTAGLRTDSQTYTATELKTALTAANAALPLAGGTMTGVLTLASGGITTDSQTYTATELKLALNAANAALPLAGGTMTGVLTLASTGLSANGTTYSAATLQSKLDNAVTDVSGKLDKSGGTMNVGSNSLTINTNMLNAATPLNITWPASAGTSTTFMSMNTAGYGSFFAGGNIPGTGGFCAIGTAQAGAYTEQIRITTAGNVGIGTTAPTSKLHVNGTGNITGTLTLGGGISADSQTYTANQLKLALNAANAALPASGGTITNTVAPQLSLYNSNASGTTGLVSLRMKNASSVSTNGFYIGVNSSNQGVISNDENQGVLFQTASTERMRINNIGNVGIGTNAPTSLLHVAGTANITGAVTTGSTLGVGGLLTLNTAGLSADSVTFTASQVKNALSSFNTVYSGTVAAGILQDSYFTMAAIGNPPAGIYAFTIRLDGETAGTQENSSAAGTFYKSPSYMPGLVCTYNGISCRANSSEIWITNPLQSAVTYRLEAKKIF